MDIDIKEFKYVGFVPLNRDEQNNPPSVSSLSWTAYPIRFAENATTVFAITGKSGTYVYARVVKSSESSVVKRSLCLNWHQLLHFPDITGSSCVFNPRMPLMWGHVDCHLVIIVASKIMMLTRTRIGFQPPPTCIYDAANGSQSQEQGHVIEINNVSFTDDGDILLAFSSHTQTIHSMRWCQEPGQIKWTWRHSDVPFDQEPGEFYSLIGCTPVDDGSHIFAVANSSTIRIFERINDDNQADWMRILDGETELSDAAVMQFNTNGGLLAVLDRAGEVHIFCTRNELRQPCIQELCTLEPRAIVPTKMAWRNDFTLILCGKSMDELLCVELADYTGAPVLRRVVPQAKTGTAPFNDVLAIVAPPKISSAIVLLGYNSIVHFFSKHYAYKEVERDIVHENFLTRKFMVPGCKLLTYKGEVGRTNDRLTFCLRELEDQLRNVEDRANTFSDKVELILKRFYEGDVDGNGVVAECERLHQSIGNGRGGYPNMQVPVFDPYKVYGSNRQSSNQSSEDASDST